MATNMQSCVPYEMELTQKTSHLSTLLCGPNFSSSTSGFYDADYKRVFHSAGCHSIRSESSMSWGEDEFEGESTRVVANMFIQFDKILYGEIDNHCIKVPRTPFLENFMKKSINEDLKLKQLQSMKITDQTDEGIVKDKDPNVLSQPTQSLIEESKVWFETFPHMRVRGVGINPTKLVYLESLAIPQDESNMENSSVSEEIILQNGSYESQMSLVNISGNTDVVNKKSKNKVSSRVCSGSNDPDVLKEQILNGLFDILWSDITHTVEPMLAKYSQFLISKSMELSSLSRESSSRGSRHITKDPLDSFPIDNFETLDIDVPWRANRPISAIRRASSAIGRLSPKKTQTLFNESETIIPLRSKVLRSAGEIPNLDLKVQSVSQASSFSLPSLPNTPRPISSKCSSHLLSTVKKTEQRPATTSNLLKNRNDRRSLQYQPTPIEETIIEDPSHIPKFILSDNTTNWSRHSLYLPPITDSGSNTNSPRMRTPRERQSLHETSQKMSILTRSFSGPQLLLDSCKSTKKLHNNFVMSPRNIEPILPWPVEKITDLDINKPPKSSKRLDNDNQFRKGLKDAKSID